MPPKSPKSNLNNASHNQLMKVAGIGKILAKRLKEHMPFDNWADVEHIPDVGLVRVARLKKFFEIEHDAEHSDGCENDSGGLCSNTKVTARVNTGRDDTYDTVDIVEIREYSWCVVS